MTSKKHESKTHLEELKGSFPCETDFDGRFFLLNSFFSKGDVSHGQLRVFETLIETDWSLLENEIAKELEEISFRETPHNTKFDFSSDKVTKIFERFLKEDQTPIHSTMGRDFPYANNLVVLDECPHSFQKIDKNLLKKKAESAFLQYERKTSAKTSRKFHFTSDVCYQKYDSTCDFYAFHLQGFYLSGRSGISPSPIFKLLRLPYSRSACECIVWEEKNKNNNNKNKNDNIEKASFPFSFEKAWIQSKAKKKEVPYHHLQLLPYARPLSVLQKKFDPSFPWITDPDLKNEYQFFWIGLKPLEIYFQIHPEKILQQCALQSRHCRKSAEEKKEKEEEEETGNQEIRTTFQIDTSFITPAQFKSAVPGRKKETKLRFRFAVSSEEWSRQCLFYEGHPNNIFSRPTIKKFDFALDYPLPLEPTFNIALMNGNPLMCKKRESAKRGKTNTKTLEKSWRDYKKRKKQEEEKQYLFSS